MDLRDVVVKCISIGIFNKIRSIYDKKKDKKFKSSGVPKING